MTDNLTAALDAALPGTAPATATPRSPVPRPSPRVSATPSALPAEGGLMEVLVADVHPSEGNPRERMLEIPELAQSIRENGLIQPLIVRRTDEGRLIIVAGHRRYWAVRHLGWLRVEVIVRKDMAPDEELARMLVENGQRAGLDPIEEARGLHRLKTMGNLSDQAVAKKVGRSQAIVSARLALLALPVEEQEAVRSGYLKIGAAVRTARITSGRVRQLGVGRAWHLGPDHALSNLAAARCRRLKHKTGRSVGGVACGECWESVIRSDERTHQHEVSAQQGRCVLCGASSAFEQLHVPTSASEPTAGGVA